MIELPCRTAAFTQHVTSNRIDEDDDDDDIGVIYRLRVPLFMEWMSP